MSIKVVEEEVLRFLASAEPEVLCITGAWGVGKTFAWNLYRTKASKPPGQIALEDYAYVSLFGQNSLHDVRNSIFENTEPAEVSDDKGSVANWKEKGERLARQVSKHRQILTSFMPEGAVALGERVMFASLKPQIVCIDDLERAGEGLSKKDVLGLVTQLKEQKRCKVVLLLNRDALRGAADDFDEQIEKVADTIIAFEPSAAEAAAIGVKDTTPHADLIRSHCTKLGVRNIRVIKRIEKVCLRLQQLLKDHDVRVLKQAMHTAALFTFSRYQPDQAPTIDFLRGFNKRIVMDEEEEERDRPEWRALLGDYEFGHVDELDLAVAQGVIAGYLDWDFLKKHADERQKVLLLEDQDGSFHEAWNRYHHSFDDDQASVLDNMAEAFKRCISAITPLNAAGTAKLFKELGRADQARELVEYYVANREEPQEFWDLDDSPFRGEINDPDIIQLFKTKYDSFNPPLEDPATVLLRINKQSGWNPRDIARLAQVTEDEFFAMLKAPHGKALTRITTEINRFRTRGAEGSPEHTIWVRGNAALDLIAAESPINARRVRQHRSRG